MKEKFFLLLLLVPVFFISCSKQGFVTDPAAVISYADTVRFDTVFTSIGSITKHFAIVNSNDQKLRISSVKLMGGSQSAFKINIDGQPVTQVDNIELEAGDSVYVFVSVTVDPSSGATPFLIKDSIGIGYNGNTVYTQLEAYGQNAHFLKDHVVGEDTQWENDLPYVISGGLYVEEGAALTIEKGCRIYMYANAPILVNGSLIVNGTAEERVIMQGDRLDRGYKDLPASWPGIVFSASSHNNNLRFGVIKNAYQAITTVGPSAGASPKLKLSQCVVDNIYDTGLLAYGSEIEAVNCLISNCGANIYLAGGTYNFTHCTISSFNNTYFNHTRPLVFLTDTYENVSNVELNATFKNCIIWGDGSVVENEIRTEKKGNAGFNILLDHTLYGTQQTPPEAEEINCIVNQDPLFDSIDVVRKIFDFRLQAASPGIGVGDAAGITIDLDNNTRTGEADLGCYAKP